jgi:hypothetical protein
MDGTRGGSVLLTNRYWWSPEWFCLVEKHSQVRPARYARTFFRTQRGSIGGVRSDLALMILS